MKHLSRAILLPQSECRNLLNSWWVYSTRVLSTAASSSEPAPVATSIDICGKGYYFSDPSFELVKRRDWSREVEEYLEKSSLQWSHESVVYVIKDIGNDAEKVWTFFNWVAGRDGFKPNSCCYSVLLRALIMMDSKKMFWLALEKMKQQMVYLDEETYRTLLRVLKNRKNHSDLKSLKVFYRTMTKDNEEENMVNTVLDVILECEWNVEVESRLAQVVSSMSDGFIIRVLKNLWDHRKKAMNFFRWVSKFEHFEHNVITYNAMLRVLCSENSMYEFWLLVEEMNKAGIVIDSDTYTKLSRKLQAFKKMEDAVNLLIFMMDSPFKPSSKNCLILLRNISQADNPDIDLVDRIVKKYEAVGGLQSKAMFDVVHRSLVNAGRFDEAKMKVESMKLAGFHPDNIIYSQMIFGLCKSKRLEEAGEIIEEMEGKNCGPDIKTWTILIQGHCAANQIDKAFDYFERMIKSGCEPDGQTLGVLVEGLLAQNKAEEANALLFDFVEKRNVKPLGQTCKLLIYKLLKDRKLDAALGVLRLMKATNDSPFAEPFVNFISKYGTIEDANKFLKASSVKEFASPAAYRNVFEGFLRENRTVEAKELFFASPYHIRKHREIVQLFDSNYNTMLS